jgi:hypothetical protein
MLVNQGVISIRHWVGIDADPTVMRQKDRGSLRRLALRRARRMGLSDFVHGTVGPRQIALIVTLPCLSLITSFLIGD